MVVGQHIFGVALVGGYAVHAFFCLSGFLMTLLMCETYKGRPLDFALNRFLRLYPSYFATAAVVAVLILYLPVPEMIGGSLYRWGLPTTPSDIIKNLTLTAGNYDIRLVPTSWAVTNELIYYVVIGAGATATLSRSVVCLIASLGITYWLLNAGQPGVYFHPAAPALSFAVGAVTYHLGKLPRVQAALKSNIIPILAVAAMFVIGSMRGTVLSGLPLLYANMIAFTPIVLWLSQLKANKVDNWVGKFSYPIYLCHMPAILFLVQTPPFWVAEWWFRPAVCLVTVAFSTALVLLVDVPVERLRRAIRLGKLAPT